MRRATTAVGAILGAGLASLTACGDGKTSAEPARDPRSTLPGVPGVPPLPATVAALRGSIDMRTGALSFEDVTPSLIQAPAGGASRAVYGDQNVSVKLYNSTVVIDSTTTPGTKVWTGNVGLRNLLTHAIGDEQGGAIAPDTMGVFVFFNTTPTITGTSGTCTGCAVTIVRADGTGNFSGTGQRYFWWRDRVAAGDTTKVRKLWSFSAPSAVTAFSFTVLVNAAWPAPNETRWKVVLNNDSLPATQEEPRWQIDSALAGNSATASGGILTITTVNSGGMYRFFRRDSIAATGSAYIEARMQSTSANRNRPEARITIDDGVRYMSLGIAKDMIGFSDTSATFVTGTTATLTGTATTYNTYQLRKYGSDSVVILANGARMVSRSYALMPLTAYLAGESRFQFGNRSITSVSGGLWDYVVYEIGSPIP